MRIPRDLDGPDLVKALRVLGYAATRQRGSHIRLTTHLNGEHHEVVPNHFPVAVGTLRTILKSIAAHHKLTVEDLIEKLDL
jgi:predicted RNA binding protein YcfA (HicA-like mRNA interferase family)